MWLCKVDVCLSLSLASQLFCVCVCLQHALRLMAFGQIYKVLEMDPLPSNKPLQKFPWSDKEGGCLRSSTTSSLSVYLLWFWSCLVFLCVCYNLSPCVVDKSQSCQWNVHMTHLHRLHDLSVDLLHMFVFVFFSTK